MSTLPAILPLASNSPGPGNVIKIVEENCGFLPESFQAMCWSTLPIAAHSAPSWVLWCRASASMVQPEYLVDQIWIWPLDFNLTYLPAHTFGVDLSFPSRGPAEKSVLDCVTCFRSFWSEQLVSSHSHPFSARAVDVFSQLQLILLVYDHRFCICGLRKKSEAHS